MSWRAALCALFIVSSLATAARAAEETLSAGRFGDVTIYRATPHPGQVVLFASGDGGWNLGVVDMARAIAKLDALVIGFNTVHYLRELDQTQGPCLYPASDLEWLSKFVQKKLDLPEYRAPVLIGYSSGATLVYAALAQAPPATFRGAISLGFCPELPTPRLFCRGSGLPTALLPKNKGCRFLPAPALEVPWIALQGAVDRVCSAESTEDFVRRVPGARCLILPKVGHGFSVQAHWMPQFQEAFGEIGRSKSIVPIRNASVASPVSDLPLIEVPSTGEARDLLALHITGDGGWGVTDRGLCEYLAAHGVSVVALNALHYFWKARTPDETARDVERVLRCYLDTWQRQGIVLVGYSLGADVLPFVVTRLPEDLRKRVRLIVFLGLGHKAEFEFHLTEWLGGEGADALPVAPELARITGTEMLCFYGASDSDALCPEERSHVTAIELPGGHRIGGDFGPVGTEILSRLQ